MKTTTLEKIRDFKPCKKGWNRLLRYLNKTEADDKPLLMSTILKSNGLRDALWCLRAFYADYRQTVNKFNCDYAESGLNIWENWAKHFATEHIDAPRKAIKAVRSEDFSPFDDTSDVGKAVSKAAQAVDTAYAYADTAYVKHANDGIYHRLTPYQAIGEATNAAYAAAMAVVAANNVNNIDVIKAANNAVYSSDYLLDRRTQKALLIHHFG
jgi:hypothetical protein